MFIILILMQISLRRNVKIVLCFCSNNVDDIIQVEFLALCRHLTRLTFDGNPLCVAPNPAAADVSYHSFSNVFE